MPDQAPLLFFLAPFFKGAALMASLIIAIGPQNAFILRQGIQRNHPFLVAFVCTVCDGLLIALGCAGLGHILATNEYLMLLARWGGAAFLLYFAFKSFRSALRSHAALTLNVPVERNLSKLIATTIAVSVLNPGAILDTVVLVGSVSSRYEIVPRALFGAGAFVTSVIWFYALAIGSHKMAPILARPKTWRIIDFIVGSTMALIAISLVRG
jgi:L-lysine exporter family protein LysE/ArgO